MLNDRSISILLNIVQSKSPISLPTLLSTHGISRRNLYYDLEKINFWLKKKRLPPVQLIENQLIFEGDHACVMEYLRTLSLDEYMFSPQGRIALILYNLALSRHPIVAEELANRLMVSKNTIKADMQTLKAVTARFQVSLLSTQYGYALEANENAIRYMLLYSLFSDCATHARGLIINQVINCVKELFPAAADGIQTQLTDILLEAEQTLGRTLTDDTAMEMSLAIILHFIRIELGYSLNIDELDFIRARQEFATANQIVSGLHTLGLTPLEQLSEYVTMLLLGARTFYCYTASTEEGNLRDFAHKLIRQMEMRLGIVIPEKEQLERKILNHIQPMYFRLKYGIYTNHILTNEIQSTYHHYYSITKSAVAELEHILGIAVSPDEVAYLCIYFLSWLRECGVDYPTHPNAKILILCHAGVGTSMMLREQMMSLLGGNYEYQVASVREWSNVDEQDYALMISTVDFPGIPPGCILVDPILTELQRELIQRKMNGITLGGRPYAIDILLKIIGRHATITDEETLVSELRDYLRQGSKDISHGLERILTPSFLQVYPSCEDWKAAIPLACELLVEQGVIAEEFAASILTIIAQYGMYFEISQGILLLHSDTAELVKRMGISITVFQKAVSFPEYNKNIHTFITLAAIDRTSHTQLLRDLLEQIADPQISMRLANGDFATREDLYASIFPAKNRTNS